MFYAGLIILCCFLVSTHFTGGLYAKYSTTSYGEDSARVAKFNVTNAFQDSQPVDLKLNFFDIKALSQTVNIVVNSDSEVAIKYDVIITMPEKDKLGNDVSYDDWLVVTVDDKPTTFEANVFTYSVDANTIAPNDTT